MRGSEMPKEIKQDDEANHTMYLYKDGKCVGKVQGMEMVRLKTELNAGVE
jgi:hypothetical protein